MLPRVGRFGAAMKEQYVGDINDYRKYALLRALADGGRTEIGVAWMLTTSDGGNDGNKLAYLGKPEFRGYNSKLFDLLRDVAGQPDRRRLASIEESGIVPGARYFNAALPDALQSCRAYFSAMRTALQAPDLIFFDPDNGLDVTSVPRGRRNSSKYLFRDELADTYALGKSVLFYQHYPRVERRSYELGIGRELERLCPDCAAFCFSTGHVAFFLAAQPTHQGLAQSAANLAKADHEHMLTTRRLSAGLDAR